MKNIFSIFALVSLTVILSSCAGEELYTIEELEYDAQDSVSFPQPTPVLTECYHLNTVLVDYATVIDENNVVDFTVKLQDSYQAIYSDGTVKDSVRTREYQFSDVRDNEFRGVNLSMSKGFAYTQNEISGTAIVVKKKAKAEADSVVVNENGWTVVREHKTVHHNLVSTSGKDKVDALTEGNSFTAKFNDPEALYFGVVEFSPVTVKISPTTVFYHHRDLSFAYDAENGVWLDRPWESGEDIASSEGIQTENGWFLRYPVLCTSNVRVLNGEEEIFTTQLSAEFEYWVPFVA